MESTTDIRRIHTINNYLKEYFGHKVIKLSLDGGFNCPNRDGSKGVGGCTFCSSDGSGEMATSLLNISDSAIQSSLDDQISLLSMKWPNANGYIAYFQSHTNTYAPVEKLRALFFKALENENIIGIAIATRPDCINAEILELLDELNKKTFLWVELGLQTYNDNIARELNRCYPTSEYEFWIKSLLSKNIRVVTHLILGLPHESEESMVNSVQEVCKAYDGKYIFGLKFHMLNLVEGSTLARENPSYVSFESIDQYTDLVIKLLGYIPWDITVHRLTADVPRKLLISPEWSYKKRSILNEITRKMRSNNFVQGYLIDDYNQA